MVSISRPKYWQTIYGAIMTIFAANLKLPFETDMLDLARRECDLKKRQHFMVMPETIPAKVLQFLDARGITLTHGEAFFTPPRELLPLHVDGPVINDLTKLNWCWGAWGSKMFWWKLKKGIEPEAKVTKIGTRYLTMQAKDCVPVHSAQIGQPTLVNVGQPHSIMNMTTEGRWVLSLVLWDKVNDCALQMPEAVERFKDLISP
jgi:hypothetical protein